MPLRTQILNFISYSQYLEDLILLCIFYDIEKGFYIDVGANDPNYISVTKAFYLRNWHGINIEPLPNKYNLLLKDRPRDINLQVGVGKTKGNATLYLKRAGSTMIPKFANKNSKSINIKIETMANICSKYISRNRNIHFCKIDVEGGEKNVLSGFDFKNYRPKVFIIESTKPGTGVPCYSEWEYILLENDYSFVYQYRINRLYIDNKASYLKERILHINDYIKLYKNNRNKKRIK